MIALGAMLGLAAMLQAAGWRSVAADIRQHLELARQAASLGRIDQALAHAAVVNPDRPLRIRVDCTGIPRAQQGLFRNALSGAISMWQAALGRAVFAVVENGATDLSVHFIGDVNDRGMEVCGHSEWTRGVLNPDTDPEVVFRADVQVRTVRPDGISMSFEQLRACAAHELGHVLGLDDSPNSDDVMGRMDFNHPALWIHPEEVEELRQARTVAENIRRYLGNRLQKL